MSLPDTSRHGIIEAHAGTGKTFTIVAMVVDLLARERLHLREILLVTYTEKAAGELAKRIREGIGKAIEGTGDETLRTHLRECLGELGECWIGTIHGVALRILRAWPFESGLSFRTELVDDEEGLDSVLRAVWRRDPFGLTDDEILLLRGGRNMGRMLDIARGIALAGIDPDAVVLPAGFDAPGAVDGTREERRLLGPRRDEIESRVVLSKSVFLRELEATVAEASGLDASGFSKSLSKRWVSTLSRWRNCVERREARTRGKVLGTGRPLRDSLGKADASNPVAQRAADLWDRVDAAWRESLEADCDALAEMEASIAALDATLRSGILAGWAVIAAREWRQRKVSEGLLSYQDMLERLRDAVRDEPFRRTLRRRIRVGIIDEFQDTGALQWDIFRHWFVSDNPGFDPRLFLVGDPKQSIYSFQGADVRTYLRACRDLEEAGGRRFALRHNWRSTAEFVAAQNTLLHGTPWFTEGIVYGRGNEVLVPERAAPPRPGANDAVGPPVRIVPIDGSAGSRRALWASHVARTILSLRGRTVALPDGNEWTERTLDWGDFAVAVQARSSVASFRRAFRRAGIPFAMYKESGVFGSRAAREFATLLAALIEPPSANSAKLRVLLTRFFGIPPEHLDPAVHLSDMSPANDVLAHLSRHALQGRWTLLFQEILERTGVQERLLAGAEGDRDWMDLRQTMSHALEFLVLGRGGIPELLEHLGRLATGDEEAAEDRNLHARATNRARVQILTMHVSKGLEFPVVFLSPGQDPKARETSRWIEESDGRLRLHVAAKEHGSSQMSVTQAMEESERLLYVAITRPKLLLAMPYFSRKGGPDNLLSRHLEPFVASGGEGIAIEPPSGGSAVASDPETAPATHPAARRDVTGLALPERTRFLSSYSALSRATHSHGLEGRPNRAEELTESVIAAPAAERPDAWLPRGASAGDALHEVLESLARQDDLTWCLERPEPPEWLLREARSALSANGLSPELAPKVARLAIEALASPLPLPDGDTVRLAGLPGTHRRPEVEFHCAFDGNGSLILPGTALAGHRGWLVGYIDLLFRHEDLWYVLDWKTTTLPSWDRDALEQGMREHDYLLQASLYARVVASARPAMRCGGAVYVFLRALAGERPEPTLGAWSAPGPSLDGPLVASRLEAWLRSRRNPSAREAAP